MAGYAVTYSVVDNATKQLDAINRRIVATRAPLDRLSKQVSRFVDVSGLRKVATGFEWIGKAAAGVLRTLTSVASTMGLITGAASLAGMAKLVTQYAAWGRTLTENADNIGISTQQLQKFQDATRLAGGNVEDMTDGLKTLHTNLAQGLIGGNNDAVAAMNRLGIVFQNADGSLKSMSEVMPQVIEKIAAMPDPARRAAFAAQLLGSNGDRLVETFRLYKDGLSGATREAEKFITLTDEQRQQMLLFGQAQGKVETALDRLGQQISVLLARHFTPLLQHFADFVQRNTPAIIAAVDKLSQQFATWLDNVDWTKVQDGINKLLEALKAIADNFETIKVAATFLLIFFAGKWALGMVAAVSQVSLALGSTGLLGKLLAVTNAATLAFTALRKMQDAQTLAPENLAVGSPFWEGIPDEVQKQFPNSPLRQKEAQAQNPSFTQSPLGWVQRRFGLTPNGPDVGPTTRSADDKQKFFDEQRDAITKAARDRGLKNPEVIGALGATQASLESGFGKRSVGNNVYGIKAGGGVGSGSVTATTGEEVNGRMVSTQASFATFKDKQEAAEAYVDFLMKNKRYQGVLGAKTVDEAINAQGDSGYATDSQYKPKLKQTFAAHGSPATGVAPPVQVGQAAAPNGSVDVNITHKNPPPNAAVTASGTGAVTVAPVRVEHQNMAEL